jgi:integrase
MMRWEEVNWDSLEWRIPMTKNGEPVIVPLVPRAMEILRGRHAQTKSEWVFPHERDKTKHIADPKEEWSRTLARATLYRWREQKATVSWQAEVESKLHNADDKTVLKRIIEHAKAENILLPTSLMDIHLHDIRRTFGSYQALAGSSLLTIGKSLGHKSTEVTQVYARLNTDAVRKSIEKATEAMFQ